ncbi:MAG: methionine adenosyltransferase, partial [Patescibacteria group bacterium]|nr:methionine adenosyltransferase [Patescibacteria group bacterium]
LSAEQGDDGQVGRGNRVWGLITPCRQMSMEAAAGKNINHPGKLYQILSFLIAQKIGKIKGVRECYVKLLNEIGRPLDLPQIALIELNVENFGKAKKEAQLICQNFLNHLRKIQKDIVKGKYQLF